MQLHHIEAFVTVVEYGTVTEASNRLRIAQPALSRYIHILERELGQPLFDHHGRRLHLTPFGQWAYDKARHILEETQSLANGRDGKSLNLGASLTTLTTFLPQAIRGFRERSPHSEIHVETGLSADIYELVGNGRVDVGLVSDARPRASYRVIPLFTDPLWVLCPTSSPFKDIESINLQHLHGQPMILMTSRTVLRADLDALFRSLHIIPDIRMEVDNVEVIQRMVATGLGATILPRSVCLEPGPLAGWRAIPLAGPEFFTPKSRGLSRTFGLITLLAEPAPIVETWIDLCVDLAKKFQNRTQEPLAY